MEIYDRKQKVNPLQHQNDKLLGPIYLGPRIGAAWQLPQGEDVWGFIQMRQRADEQWSNSALLAYIRGHTNEFCMSCRNGLIKNLGISPCKYSAAASWKGVRMLLSEDVTNSAAGNDLQTSTTLPHPEWDL